MKYNQNKFLKKSNKMKKKNEKVKNFSITVSQMEITKHKIYTVDIVISIAIVINYIYLKSNALDLK